LQQLRQSAVKLHAIKMSSDPVVYKQLSLLRIDQKTTRWPQYLAGFGASLGAFASGTGLGWSAPAGPRLVNEGQYFPITQVQMDLASSVLTIGLAISCLPVGYLMNAFGRKWTMIGSVLPYMIGWGLVIWAQNFTMLLFGRFFLGLAGGAFCVSAPQYSAEITEKEIRGIVGTFFQLLIIAGILFVYIIGAITTVFWMNVICSIFPLIFGVFFFFMPESPVYLISKNRIDEAARSIKWLRGRSYNPQDEIEDLKIEIFGKQGGVRPSYREVFSRPETKESIIIIFGVKIFQQTSGISIVIFYTTSIFIVRTKF
jgi:MFS family permease